MSSPVSALFSWLVMGGVALFVGFASLAWPEDGIWMAIEEAMLEARLPPPKPKIEEKRPVIAALAEEGGQDTDDGTGTDTGADADTDSAGSGTDGEEPLDSPVPLEQVPELPDAESVLDELPAEGVASRRKVQRFKVGAARIDTVEGESDWLVHRIVPMETPEQIAYRYGVRPESLRMWNGLKPETTKLRVGTRLKLHPRRVPPQRRQHEYWVQPGDTWWSIGTTFGIDSRDLRATNLSSPQRPLAGTKIEIWIDPIVYLWVSGETDPHVPAGIRLGAVGVGPPQAGRLFNGVQLPLHEAYELKLPPSAYGTTHAVAHVVKTMDAFHERSKYRERLMIGSMSGKHGGLLAGHKSHQSGRDLDIRLPLLERLPNNAPVTAARVDWVALWHLIEAFDASGQVVVIFLDYEMQEHLYKAAVSIGVDEARRGEVLQFPHGNKATLGLVRHSPGHLAHIHVRMTCGPSEPECVSEADFDIDAE